MTLEAYSGSTAKMFSDKLISLGLTVVTNMMGDLPCCAIIQTYVPAVEQIRSPNLEVSCFEAHVLCDTGHRCTPWGRCSVGHR